MNEIALIGFVQCVFFSILIATKKRIEGKDYLLIVFLLLVGAELIYRYLLGVLPAHKTRWMAMFDIVYWSMFGPLTLLYIQTATQSLQKLKSLHLLHLLPLLIGLLGIKNFYLGRVHYSSFINYFNESSGWQKAALLIWDNASPAYLVVSLIILLQHQRRVKDYFTNLAGKDLKWLLNLVTGFVIYLGFSYGFSIFREVFSISPDFRLLQILPAILTIYVFVIGWFGYRQHGIFFNIASGEPGKTQGRQTDSGEKKYARTGLSDHERITLINKVKVIMNDEKPWIECDFNLVDLAVKLDTTPHKISQVINESFNRNFFDFINTYRIEAVKQVLKDPTSANLTIMAVAYDCGFSTKSAFYNAFKKHTGITPGEYLRKSRTLQSQTVNN